MRFACWLNKATNTHSEYFIFIAIPLHERSHERASMLRYNFLLSTTSKMHCYKIFLIISKLCMFRAVSPPVIRSSRIIHTASVMCQACLLLPLAWLSWNSTTLTVAASNPGTYQLLCVQFLSS